MPNETNQAWSPLVKDTILLGNLVCDLIRGGTCFVVFGTGILVCDLIRGDTCLALLGTRVYDRRWLFRYGRIAQKRNYTDGISVPMAGRRGSARDIPGCARFAEILTVFKWTHKNLEFRRQKILNSKIDFQLDIHFISSLCLHVGILQHCLNPLYQLVPNVLLF